MGSTEAPISITVKTPAGSLVTVRAEHGAELDGLITEAYASILSAVTELEKGVRPEGVSLPQAVSNVASQFAGATIVAEPTPFANPSIELREQIAKEIGLRSGRNCPHGKMTALQGASKQGGVYKGYFCPTAQGAADKCRTIYIQKHDPEWNTFVPDRIK